MRRIAALPLLVALIAAGCGDGSDGTTTTTKANYLEVADAICRNHQSRREDLESQAASLGPLTSARKAREVADLLRQESRNLRSEIQELQSRRPSTASAELASFFLVLRTRAVALDRWAQAYDDLDEAEIARLQARVGSIATVAEERARKYGFRVCGR